MKVSAGPYTLDLPTNGVALLYEDGRQLPGGVGYLSALVEFAGEVIRLNAEIAALREIAARPSPELHALTKERDELRERCAASDVDILIEVGRNEGLEAAAQFIEEQQRRQRIWLPFGDAIRALKGQP